jgi:hypothetical protein
MLFDRMMNRPMQSFGMGQTYVPDSGFDGGGTGGASFRHNVGIVPPHMQTGGGGQMQPLIAPHGPSLHTGGMNPAVPYGVGPGQAIPNQAFPRPMQTGGPGQMLPMHQFNPWAAFLGRGY